MPDLDAYREWSKTKAFARRVDAARTTLRVAAALGPLIVSTSWGKDSVALADLALDTLGPVPLLHQASAYRLPGWDRVAEHFAARTPVHVIEPKRTLAETIAWLHEIGLGYERARHSSRATHRAKRDAADEWCEARGFRVQALGLRIDEGGPRARVLKTRGPIYARAGGATIACPLARWDARDVWARIVSRELPYHPLYDRETHGRTRETLRNTGWLTTIDAPDGRIAWLRAHYPEQYRALVLEFPRVAALA